MGTHDVVIVGGAAMGSAAALHLRRLDPTLDVVVVEREPSYEHCSTLRSDGNLRVQFNLLENVQMSLHTFELLDTFADDFGVDGWRPQPMPRHNGNLFLTDEAGREAAMTGLELQQSLGCDVEWLDIEEVAERWPVYGCAAEEVVGGTYGPLDGAIDPTAVLEGLRRTAAALGAEYRAADVTGILVEHGRVAGVSLGDGDRLEAPVVVVCAGAWSTELVATAGVQIPVEPVMRTVYVVEGPHDVTKLPSVFLPSNLYTLPEASNTMQVAWSTADDPTGFDFDFTRRGFEERVWPELFRVMPAFDRLAVVGGWCGLYAMNTLDHNAILGEWPELPGLHLATGFSGHGFQHTPAMGRYLAELLTGAAVTLDLGRFSPQRILEGAPLRENEGRII